MPAGVLRGRTAGAEPRAPERNDEHGRHARHRHHPQPGRPGPGLGRAVPGRYIEFMGEIVGGTILFGAVDAEPLLGVTALESAGIEVDPTSQRLKRLPAVRLKRLREPA